MEYQALYRKYRPKNFNEVVGQTVAVQILKNAINNNKVSHAYLFFGPRGTGKTSIAKILSRTINCENVKDGIPCEECESCLNSKNIECVDIIEIDAASNNGVDEIRELKNKISFLPTQLKYKVYIVDEVHMLSTGAFNALLKTLEEPPEHVVFILATTELQKVPLTIISRCQTLEFKKIDDSSMAKKLNEIAKKEKIKIDENGIKEIARYSNGGLRDAIGLLEKAVAYTDDEINENIIKEISGNVSERELIEFYELINNQKIEEIIENINKYYNEGIDLINLLNSLIDYLRNKMIITKEYNQQTCKFIIELDNLVTQMEKSENPKILLEASLINIIFEKNSDNNPLQKKVEDNKIENQNDKITKENVDDNKKEEFISQKELKEIRVGNTLCNPQKNIISDIRKKWDLIKDFAFDDEIGNVARLLSSDIAPVAASDTNIILLSKLNGLANQINNDIITVEKIIEKAFNLKIKAVCISEQEWKNYTEEYKNNKEKFKYREETKEENKNKTLKEKAKELFDD